MALNRRFLFVLILMLALACYAPPLLREAEAAAAPDGSEYVRLHVVAADDSPRAQALKLEVRDAVLACARNLLADVGDADAAWRVVNDHVGALEAAARAVAPDARCEVGVFPFPDREYGGTRVPAGDYRALRVVIGAGRGHNWWCVLYPSLCYPEEWKTGDGAFYSSVWNWLQSLFGGDDTCGG